MITVDDDAANWAARVGLQSEPFDGKAASLADADVLVLGPRSLPKFRGWRATGVRVPAIFVGRLPERRAELEPLECVDPEQGSPDLVATLLARADLRPILVAGGVVDLQRRCLVRGDQRTPLTQLAVDLLAFLAHRADRAVSREDLLAGVWGVSPKARTRTVDMAVSRLRKVVERDADDPRVLLTCQGYGYRYVPPVPAVIDTGLFGRQEVIATLLPRLQSEELIVLHGAPGVGKSRLARAIAQRIGGERVVVVDLDGTLGADAGAWAIASALGIGAPDAADAEQVLARVFESPRLPILVVDDADGCPRLPAMLARLRRGPPMLITLRLAPDLLREATWRVDPLDEASALIWLRERRLGLDEDALRQVIHSVGTLPLALEVAAPRAAALGGDASPAALLAAGSDGTLARAVRSTLRAWAAPTREALTALSALRAPIRVADLTAILERDAVDDWVAMHEAGLLKVESGRGSLLPAIREILRAQASTATPPRHRAWLVQRVVELAMRLEGEQAQNAVDELTLLQQDAWELADADLGSEDSARLFLVLDEVAVWQGAPKRNRWTKLDLQLAHATTPRARAILLCRRAELIGATDWKQAADNALEGLRDCPDNDIAVRLACRFATAAGWRSELQSARATVEAVLGRDLSEAERCLPRAFASTLLVRLGQLDPTQAATQMVGDFEQLVADGALQTACQVSIQALPLLRLQGPNPRMLAIARRALAVADQVGHPVLQATLNVLVAQPLGALGQIEASLERFAEADRLFAKVDPIRCLQVASVRGRLLCEEGLHEAARRDFQRYLAWAQSRSIATATADAALWLVSIEGDAGDFDAMRRYADLAVRTSRRSDPHLLAHAKLGRLHADVLSEAWEPAAETLAGLDSKLLSPIGKTTRLTCALVLGRETGDDTGRDASRDALNALIREGEGPYWDAVHEIVLAADAGEFAALHQRFDGVEERLLARTWLVGTGASRG